MKKILFTFSFFVLLLLVLFRFSQINKYNTIVNELPEIYKHEVITKKDDYEQACKYEIESGYYFPAAKRVKAKIHSGFFRFDRKMSAENTKALTAILNDPNSYIWGEIGTPDIHKRIIFYNEKNQIVGLTEFSYEGQTYSYPHLNRMKWGMLNEKAKNRIIDFLDDKN